MTSELHIFTRTQREIRSWCKQKANNFCQIVTPTIYYMIPFSQWFVFIKKTHSDGKYTDGDGVLYDILSFLSSFISLHFTDAVKCSLREIDFYRPILF